MRDISETGRAPQKASHRVLRALVWTSRAAGWLLIALAVLNALPLPTLARAEGSVRLVSSLVLGLLGLAWVLGLEVFLRFFDRYLSRN